LTLKAVFQYFSCRVRNANAQVCAFLGQTVYLISAPIVHSRGRCHNNHIARRVRYIVGKTRKQIMLYLVWPHRQIIPSASSADQSMKKPTRPAIPNPRQDRFTKRLLGPAFISTIYHIVRK